MRYRISEKDRKKIFSHLKQTCGTWKIVSEEIGVTTRTLSGWKSGLVSLPEKSFEKILAIANVQSPSKIERLPDYWYTSYAGKIGAEVSQKLYGNPGTPDGRKKGGLHAISTHKKNAASRFRSEKSIQIPQPSAELAEILGIFFGDGHLGKYQASITLNSETDYEYGRFVASIIEKQCSIKPSIRKKRHEKAFDVVISSIAFVKFLGSLGMPIGNKIHSGLSIPKWIKIEKNYLAAFLRGLFDTDGCIYLDKHIIKGKTYYHLGWTITSYSDTLIVDVKEALENLHFHPTHSKNQHSVFLRKHQEILRCFESISTNNPKHRGRFEQFIKEK